MERKIINLYKTKNGSYFVSPEKELTEGSLIKIKNLTEGWGRPQTLVNLLWSAKAIEEVKFLGSYESLEAAEAAIKAEEAQLEAAFN